MESQKYKVLRANLMAHLVGGWLSDENASLNDIRDNVPELTDWILEDCELFDDEA